MYNSITISAQLPALVDRLGFGKICYGANADKRYRHFTARTLLHAMMIAQLTEQKVLRMIEETIASDNNLYHAGVSTYITRPNLAHANEKRPCKVFQKFYFHLIEHYKFLSGRGSRKGMKNLKLSDLRHGLLQQESVPGAHGILNFFCHDDSFTIRRDEIIRMKIGNSKKNPKYVTVC